MIDRRTALAGIAGGIAAPALAALPRPAAYDTPDARLRAFMLMRGALDDRLSIGCVRGRYFGVVEGVTTPLFDVVSATFARYRPHPGGGYAGVSLEQAYFLDLASGEWLTRFANPYTGKTVDVPTGGYPAARIVFTADLAMEVPGGPPGQALTHAVGPIRIEGGHVWMTETTDGITASPTGKRLQYHETVGLHARAADIAAPGARQVASQASYTAIKSWRPWMGMADHPGQTVTTGQGLANATMADLPAAWLTAARRHRPDLVADPARMLEPLWRQPA